MHIFEIFDTKLHWNWLPRSKHGKYTAEFKTDNGQHGLATIWHFSKRDDNLYHLGFRMDGSAETTGNGEKYVIFATVMDIIDAFHKIEPYASVYFYAEEENRAELYDTMTSKLVKPPYEVSRTGHEFIISPTDSMKTKQGTQLREALALLRKQEQPKG